MIPTKSLEAQIDAMIETDIAYQEHERNPEPEQIDWLDESY